MLRSGNSSWVLWRLLDVTVDELSPILSAPLGKHKLSIERYEILNGMYTDAYGKLIIIYITY